MIIGSEISIVICVKMLKSSKSMKMFFSKVSKKIFLEDFFFQSFSNIYLTLLFVLEKISWEHGISINLYVTVKSGEKTDFCSKSLILSKKCQKNVKNPEKNFFNAPEKIFHQSMFKVFKRCLDNFSLR